jgi:hypothetical protein
LSSIPDDLGLPPGDYLFFLIDFDENPRPISDTEAFADLGRSLRVLVRIREPEDS